MKPDQKSESLFSAVIRDHAKSNHGSQSKFATHIGIHPSEVSWIVTGSIEPNEKKIEVIAKDMGLAPETLQSLSRVSVADTMKIVLEKLERED